MNVPQEHKINNYSIRLLNDSVNNIPLNLFLIVFYN